MNAILKAAFCFFLGASFIEVSAQDVSTPGAYMTFISEKIRNINQTYINYLSAVSHGKSARKVEKLREKTVNSIFDARSEVAGTLPYKGDKTLRDATVAYLKTCYIVFNEDYGKIVNMEEIAEQSYDAMEAYLMAQEKAGEKLTEAGDVRNTVEKTFAQKYNITIDDRKDALDLKMELADKVNDYYNKVYLVFFKSNRQEAYLVDAINRKDINSIEQNRNALLNYSTAGLETLKDVNAFQSDATLLAACQRALIFYKDLAEKKITKASDYMLAEENFSKTKKAFDAKPASKRTQPDIDAYNKAVNDINAAGNAYNKMNNEINKERDQVINGWNDAVKKFMDDHMPYKN
jgi:ribosomal 50S subunit-associated protein YjgA (DUF615 family)